MLILIKNAKRAGDIVNMTIKEFDEVRPSQSNSIDHFVYVKAHKTSATHFSRVNFYGEIYDMANHYDKVFGTKFLAPSGFFFPHVSVIEGMPRQMTSSELNVALNRTWREFCDRSKIACTNITTSIIRKSIITVVYKRATCTNEVKQNLASHMAHSSDTARRHYDRTLGFEVSSKVTQDIRNILYLPDNILSDDDSDVASVSPMQNELSSSVTKVNETETTSTSAAALTAPSTSATNPISNERSMQKTIGKKKRKKAGPRSRSTCSRPP
jgi:hypothetical protein